eukprot:Hpha_TRINITY_DN16428_c2_g6::TRINITY_DN16428_c2_g6_i1::g.163120::m.163120
MTMSDADVPTPSNSPNADSPRHDPTADAEWSPGSAQTPPKIDGRTPTDPMCPAKRATTTTPAPSLLSEEPNRSMSVDRKAVKQAFLVGQKGGSPQDHQPRAGRSTSPEPRHPNGDGRPATPPRLLDELAPGSGGVLIGATPLRATSIEAIVAATPILQAPATTPVRPPATTDPIDNVPDDIPRAQLQYNAEPAEVAGTDRQLFAGGPEPPPLVPLEGGASSEGSPPSMFNYAQQQQPRVRSYQPPQYDMGQAGLLGAEAALLAGGDLTPEMLDVAAGGLGSMWPDNTALQQLASSMGTPTQQLAAMREQQQQLLEILAQEQQAQGYSPAGYSPGGGVGLDLGLGMPRDDLSIFRETQRRVTPDHPTERFEGVAMQEQLLAATQYPDGLRMGSSDAARALTARALASASGNTHQFDQQYARDATAARLNGFPSPSVSPLSTTPVPPHVTDDLVTFINSRQQQQYPPSAQQGPQGGVRQPTRRILVAMPGGATGARGGGGADRACHQVTVRFKRGRQQQYLSSFPVKVGDYAIVTGDRGEDLGLVTDCWYGPRQNQPQLWQQRDSFDEHGNPVRAQNQGPGQVLRIATREEVVLLHEVQTVMERSAVESAMDCVREHQLQLELCDAEYQFDRKKLTFFYKCDSRQDFRKLVRDLWRKYRARIWMEKVEN